MHKASVSAKTAAQHHVVASIDLSNIARYGKTLKKLTNHEVSEQLDSVIEAMAQGVEMDETSWSRIRLLLEELRWRVSGLE